MKACLFAFFVALIIIGCTSTVPSSREVIPPPSFDFTPPSQAAPASAGVTLGLVDPSYTEKDPQKTVVFSVYPFTDFQKNMGRDFEELLIARGFTTTGPYRSREEMTYPEKSGCDLTLTPSLDVSVEFPDVKTESVVMLLGDPQYKIHGNAVVRGRVTLNMLESLSGEKMWSKSIDISQKTVSWEGQKRYSAPPQTVDITDPVFQKNIAPILEDVYNAVMDAGWKYLDPQEIQIVKKQAMDVKEKKRY
jgi:hypothetical protein